MFDGVERGRGERTEGVKSDALIAYSLLCVKAFFSLVFQVRSSEKTAWFFNVELLYCVIDSDKLQKKYLKKGLPM